ncbi:hypothetical protein RSP795_01410 [Ralstonia solanacearum]|uniref:hypothetical protein n=1 Tax=Ralstonia solanacearum TaxID=305 RepID=UPI0007D79C1E|nr:hypothetical protein [Ralstonia solanacearum]OAI65263.1 hypothetical protein RSP795_01410 [Ralstonia solanacearum]
MQTNIPHQPGRELYLRWVEENSQRRWPKCATIEEACWSGPAFELHTALVEAWPLTPDDEGDLTLAETTRPIAFGWLAGATCFALRRPHFLATKGGGRSLLKAWAEQAPNRRESRRIDINESRFLRWLKATDWSAFYAETMAALLVVRGVIIDAGSLYDIARMRADSIIQHSNAFSRSAAFTFYEAQPLHHD